MKPPSMQNSWIQFLVLTHLLGAVLDGGELLLLLPELGVLALQHLLLLRQRRREVEEHHLRQDLGSLIPSFLSCYGLFGKQSLTERNRSACFVKPY